MESRVRPLLRPYLSLLIVVPDKDGVEGDESWNFRCCQLLDMIHQVNESEVPEADILSDNLYYYNSEDKVFKLVCLDETA